MKLKKSIYIFLFIIIVFFLSLGIVYFQKIYPIVHGEKVAREYEEETGLSRDEHNCLLSLGYSWCEKKSKCLLAWEELCEEEISNQTLVENYIMENISELSPVKEVLGGKFYVTDFAFADDQTVEIKYEDGHNAYKAKVVFGLNTGEVIVNNFLIINSNDSSLENSSDSN